MTRNETRALSTMRNLAANGMTDEAAMIDAASEVIGGGDDARKLARRVYDQHFKIYTGG